MTYKDFIKLATDALTEWGLYSPHCVELLSMICAHESLGGKHRRQLININGRLEPRGAGRGVFQIEPQTHNSVWQFQDTIRARARRFGIVQDVDLLETDDRYSIWVARHYLLQDRNPLPLTTEAMAEYCKSYWNRTGAATPAKYLSDWQRWKDGKL